MSHRHQNSHSGSKCVQDDDTSMFNVFLAIGVGVAAIVGGTLTVGGGVKLIQGTRQKSSRGEDVTFDGAVDDFADGAAGSFKAAGGALANTFNKF